MLSIRNDGAISGTPPPSAMKACFGEANNRLFWFGGAAYNYFHKGELRHIYAMNQDKYRFQL
jgi:hypothetical protein